MLKILREIGGRIWALWAMLTFVITMLIFLIPFLLFCYFLPDPTKTMRFIAFSRIWMKVFLTLIGCPLTIKGREHFEKNRNYVVVCNHNSLMDVPVSSPAIPGGNKTIAKIEMAKVPLFGMLYRTGSVLVDRKSDASRKESYTKMKNVLKMGLNMCIYPEGTRNKTDKPLKSFHNGAFRLAIETNTPIIPALIFNSKKVLPADKTFFVAPHPLQMHFLPPIQHNQGDTPETFKRRVFEMMETYYTKNRVG
jgi:1-acyl-sn-glycerol-3-phosphate acyltransferase